MSVFDDVQIAIAAIRENYSGTPQIGVVLGSGLGAFADCVENATVIPTEHVVIRAANLGRFPNIAVSKGRTARRHAERRVHHIDVVKGDSASNGKAEKAVRDVQGMIRTWKDAVETSYST